MTTKPLPQPSETDLIRFWSKVKKTDSCWLWQAAKDEDGYGIFFINNKNCKAHRLSYLIAKGADPFDAFVYHICDTQACVRPDHLILENRKRIRRRVVQVRRIDMTHSNIIREVQRQLSMGINSQKEIALALGLSQPTVSKIKQGKLEPIDAANKDRGY